ncbi:MAG: hypothetical protein U0930_05070 [Pirellulales bacterium]
MTKPSYEETLEPVNIGKPVNWFSDSFWTDFKEYPISWWWLRRIGFRFAQAGVDNRPHMMISLNPRHDSGLEISPSASDGQSWTVWLRSDIAHSRCRFCYVRDVQKVKQIVLLIEAMGGTVTEIDFDADQFADSLAREWRDCKRRYHEYANDARWGRVPGGL